VGSALSADWVRPPTAASRIAGEAVILPGAGARLLLPLRQHPRVHPRRLPGADRGRRPDLRRPGATVPRPRTPGGASSRSSTRTWRRPTAQASASS